MRRKKSVKTGANRMGELGKKPVQLWFTEQQMELLRRVADDEMMPLATWIRRTSMTAAKCHVYRNE